MQGGKQDLKIDEDSREEKTETIEALEDKPEILISIKEKEDLQTTEKENVGVVETTKTKQQQEKLDNKESTKDWNWAQSVAFPLSNGPFFTPENGIFGLVHDSTFFVANVYVAILWWKVVSLHVGDDSERQKHFLIYTAII